MGSLDFLKKINSQVAETAVGKKSESDERCMACIVNLYAGIGGLFSFTTDRSTNKILSGKSAVDIFESGWKKFVECWNKPPKSATPTELNELKTLISNSLEKSIDDVIKSQATAKQQAEKKKNEIESKRGKRAKK